MMRYAILSARDGGRDGWVRLSEVPFDFERRCPARADAQNGEHMLIAKGTPESILARCVASSNRSARRS
ncbi:hypothetical protein [Bradyrhizobium sp. LA2.1]|uniref:hypothetical protein n=1 Tax=Bradyrhizobium sp. LA2.1 TaxID=3156376 RepID=UPI003398543C